MGSRKNPLTLRKCWSPPRRTATCFPSYTWPDWQASPSLPIRHAVALDTRRSVAQIRRDTLHQARGSKTKRALIKDITDAVVKNFGVGADAVLVEIIETSRDNKAKGGVLFSER